MLSYERIFELLQIDTQHDDSRALRIMSCENPIKDLYIYEIARIKKKYDISTIDFISTLATCIKEYNDEVANHLKGQTISMHSKNKTIYLSEELIQNAINEISTITDILRAIVLNNDYNFSQLRSLQRMKVDNFIAVLQICGLVDLSNNQFRSKILSRIQNIKEQVGNYCDERMPHEKLEEEFVSHLDYFTQQKQMIDQMQGEDFLVYVIMFDTRRYKHNRKIKSLTYY